MAQGFARQVLPLGGVVVTRGEPKHRSWFSEGLHKAIADPEYYMTVAFTWGHRLAALLLPILALCLTLAYRKRRQYFIYDHLLVAMNLLSFAFLILAVAMVLPAFVLPYAMGMAGAWTLVNLYQTLRGAYSSSRVGAVLKTVLVWSFAVMSFCTLLAGLLVFTLTQL